MSRAYLSAELRRQVRADAGGRCGYCHSSETFLSMPLDVEHLMPEARGRLTVRENLWIACPRCNDFKGDRLDASDPRTGQRILLYHPRLQRWTDHFAWALEGIRIDGQTPEGRATVDALRLNNDF